MLRFLSVLAAAGIVSTTGPNHAEAQAGAEQKAVRVSHISGKPVPRFEGLQFSEVNGRSGPSEDHRIVWRYQRAGLPMLVIKESTNWRRVRDPDGDEVWIHARMLAPTHTALVRWDSTLHRTADAGADPLAKLERHVMVTVERCEDDWCRVKADRFRGWIERADLWGVEAAPSERPA